MIQVAVMGYGTVGSGVVEVIKTNQALINKRVGEEVNVKYVLDLREFPGDPVESILVHDFETIVNDPEVKVVVEVMGGVEPAFTYACAALKAGKHFVTSNKALVAAKGTELAKLAEENHAAFLFSAACGGGVPFLHNMALSVDSDEITSVGGILNGTTNFMLDNMQSSNLSYEDALADAQRLGYAEADPTADVTGLDALRKIMLACAVAFNQLPVDGLLNEGIDSFTAEDVAYLKSEGLTCRLIASGGKNADGSVYAYVEPVLFEQSAAECSVKKNFNMAKYEGRNCGKIQMIGQGAGRWPTASAVLRDLSDICAGRMTMMKPSCTLVSAKNDGCSHSYLVRLSSDASFPLPVTDEALSIVSGYRYLTTEAIPVSAMHACAKALREKGVSVFFAAIGDK